MSQSAVVLIPNCASTDDACAPDDIVVRRESTEDGRQRWRLFTDLHDSRHESWLEEANYPASQEYEDWSELPQAFLDCLDELRVYHLTFFDVDAARVVLKSLFSRITPDLATQVWFETDYGWVLTAADFLAALEHDPKWDWRYGVNEVLCKHPKHAVKVRLNQAPMLREQQVSDHERRELAVMVELYSDLHDLELRVPEPEVFETIRLVLQGANVPGKGVNELMVNALRSIDELSELSEDKLEGLSSMFAEAWGLKG